MSVMAENCSGVIGESDCSQRCDKLSGETRRRRMEIRRSKLISGENSREWKRPRNQIPESSTECESSDGERQTLLQTTGFGIPNSPTLNSKFGFTSVCGRRRDMEDEVAIHQISDLDYFGVFDGHGCSHVSVKCRERLHELVKEEMNNEVGSDKWREVMERSFDRMDKEVSESNRLPPSVSCRCDLQLPERDAVGSTAVVSLVTSDKIIVANCGDSRAVLCRNGKPVPLSSDHKPNRPDEQSRIEAAGGRVICLDVARIFGVLSTSRALGDNSLKPYVISEPEVMITDRTEEDECLILGSDGLWDVVSNEMACSLASMCLKGRSKSSATGSSSPASDASILLTKVALSKHSTDNISVIVVDLSKN